MIARPRRNRVTPLGEIEIAPLRGTFMGNRGDLHTADGTLGPKLWKTKSWVCCCTSFRERRIKLDEPGTYTPLFFYDEAVALAAGHRPCGECRHADYQQFKASFKAAHGIPATEFVSAKAMDLSLHAARINRRGEKVTFISPLGELPDGVFILTQQQQPAIIWEGALHPWCHRGYAPPVTIRPSEAVTVLTPKPTVATLRAGYELRTSLQSTGTR